MSHGPIPIPPIVLACPRSQAEMDTAFHSLTTVYLAQAGQREKGGDLDGALDAFNHCLRAADKAGNVSAYMWAHGVGPSIDNFNHI